MIGEPVFAGLQLARAGFVIVFQTAVFRVAEKRLVVKRDFGVERHDVAVFHHSGRVDLDHQRVVGNKGFEKPAQKKVKTVIAAGLEFQKLGRPAGLGMGGTGNQIDRPGSDSAITLISLSLVLARSRVTEAWARSIAMPA